MSGDNSLLIRAQRERNSVEDWALITPISTGLRFIRSADGACRGWSLRRHIFYYLYCSPSVRFWVSAHRGALALADANSPLYTYYEPLRRDADSVLGVNYGSILPWPLLLICALS